MLYLWLIRNFGEIRYRAFLCMDYYLAAVFFAILIREFMAIILQILLLKIFVIKN